MPERLLKVAGRGDLYAEIKSRISSEGLNNVEMLGYQDRASVNELMRNAKALIMCSQWYETFGMVIAEAYSCGTPVIVGDIGNIKDLVITGKTGELFTYNSPDDMISTIKRFAANSYGEYSKNAYKLFNERLTSKSNYNQLLKIYDQLG